jgi:hypothetical protein
MLWVPLAAALPLLSQQVCAPTPTYTPCDIVFELNDQEAAAHPNPYASVELRAELRSPRARTILMQAFWHSGRKMVIRFSPTDPGTWDFRVTGNLERFNGKLGQVEATESPDPGFLLPANVHHWMTSETRKQHLWMGDAWLDFPRAPQPAFDAYLAARAGQKFNHVRGLVVSDAERAFAAAGKPDPAYFEQLDQRVAALNQKGIFSDLILAQDGPRFSTLFDGWQQRERFIRYIVSRYAAYHVTWQLLENFETGGNNRPLLKELGLLIKKYDPYNHPRSTGTMATSAPVQPDTWQNFVLHHSADDAVGAIEHQVFPTPFVNTGFSDPKTQQGDFLRRLWNSTMNGQYPSSALDPAAPDSPNAKTMANWFEFMQRTRYWELEPYFDIEGGRAVALPGAEYVIYFEKWGTVEILIEKHGYDVFWFNPATGELSKEKKDFKGEKWVGEPPSKTGEWILHLSREGRKEGMLRSYKFESRANLMQEIEQNPQKMPFEVLEPSADQLSISKPPKYSAKIKRETRGTRNMMYLWTGEAPTEGAGYRILGTGAEGTLLLPRNLAKSYPAVFNIRIYALNAVGKAYAVDRVFRVTE